MNKGSTFLEIIITLAFVGVVGFVVFTSFDRTKENVRLNNIQSTLNSVTATGLACLDSGKEVEEAYPGGRICDSSILTWPELPEGWVYTNTISDIESATFSYGAKSDIEKKEIRCSQKGCSLIK